MERRNLSYFCPMRILITNDDGYQSRGIRVLADIMKQFGEVTVLAPAEHQSGKSMAVDLGRKGLVYTDLGNGWGHLNGTPASCVKFAFNSVFAESMPDVVVSGINHGSNAAVASCYSGTLGAAQEAVVNGVPGIGVSVFNEGPDPDFSAVERYFPQIFREIMALSPRDNGIFYNVNFPRLSADEVKGVRVCTMGMCRWIKEFVRDEDGTYHMSGAVEDGVRNTEMPDHHLMIEGYVTIVPHLVDNTAYQEVTRMRGAGMDRDFAAADGDDAQTGDARPLGWDVGR